MSKLFIPSIGDRFTLHTPWAFTLYLEHRNIEFAKSRALCQEDARWSVYHPKTRELVTVTYTIDAGTELECDRIYIKSNSKSAATAEDSYDSITWKVIVDSRPSKRSRFWAKLSDCNNIEFNPNSISKYRDRK